MIAPGFVDVEAQLWIWIMAMIRPGAAMMIAPVFGATAVPIQMRIILSLMIGIAATNSAPIDLPLDNVVSFAGVMFLMAEVLAGLAMGFALQVGYAAAFVAGETISNAMGLGFAQMNDPQSGASTPVIGQFLSVLAVLLLLAMDGHLILIAIIVKSYQALPPGSAFLAPETLKGLVDFGGTLFAMGVVIALPVGSALILIQIVMAMLARSAPAMNIFAVGFPVAILSGLVLMAMAAPVIAESVMRSMQMGLDQSDRIAASGNGAQ